MLITSKFPKTIVGRTKRPRGPYAARVFETLIHVMGFPSKFSNTTTCCMALIFRNLIFCQH